MINSNFEETLTIMYHICETSTCNSESVHDWNGKARNTKGVISYKTIINSCSKQVLSIHVACTFYTS